MVVRAAGNSIVGSVKARVVSTQSFAAWDMALGGSAKRFGEPLWVFGSRRKTSERPRKRSALGRKILASHPKCSDLSRNLSVSGRKASGSGREVLATRRKGSSSSDGLRRDADGLR